MANFTKAAATAKRLVEANGRLVVLIKSNRTPADAAKPWRGTGAEPHASKGGGQAKVKMAFVPPRATGFGKTLIDRDGSLVVDIDQVGMIAATSLPAGFTVEDFERVDLVRDGADVWRVVARENIKPADVPILFSLGLKR